MIHRITAMSLELRLILHGEVAAFGERLKGRPLNCGARFVRPVDDLPSIVIAPNDRKGCWLKRTLGYMEYR